MKKKSKIVLCCSLNQGLLQQMEKIKIYGFVENIDFHLVHIHQTQAFSDGFNSYIYPGPEERDKIAVSNKGTLAGWRDKTFSEYDNASNFKVECLFSANPKNEMVEYLKKVQADLVVTATQGKHGISGFFHSSFTDYLIKFAPCDVLVLRPD